MAEDQFLPVVQATLQKARGQMLVAAEQANREIVLRHRPSTVVRVIDGTVAAADAAYTGYQVVRLAQAIARKPPRIEYHYTYMQDVVDFAILTLREHSPVGSEGDEHPGLYRDSHMVFLNGRVVADVRDFRPGDVIHISNPVPYSRKIELAKMQMSVPGHVYEMSDQIVNSRFGNQASIKFTFMPVEFGDKASFKSFSRQIRPGRRMSERARADWLASQPALEIKAR